MEDFKLIMSHVWEHVEQQTYGILLKPDLKNALYLSVNPVQLAQKY